LDRDKLIARLTATFLEELDEHVRVFNRELLALEQHPSDPWVDRVQTLFRSAHSLKGAARAVSAARVEAICHRLESVLAAVRDGPSPPTRELFELLFAAADAIDHAGKLFAGKGGAEKEAVVNAMLARLNAPLGRGETPGKPSTPQAAPERKPSTPPPPAPWAAPVRGSRPDGAAESANVVRVRRTKLDMLLAQSGELLVARRRLEARRDQVSTLQDFVARWRADWRIVDKLLAKRARRERNADDAPPGSSNHGALAISSRAERILVRNHEYLRRLERDLEHLALGSADDRQAIERAAVPLEEQIRQVRMLPFLDACEGLFRAVRDLSATQGKEVELVIDNGETEIDRSLLDAIRDPLVHLVRNAVDHGVEPAAERAAQGKTPRAKVTVSADVHGSWVDITVSDDGRGIDVPGIREHAQRKGIPCPAELDGVTRLIFAAGFSTAPMITEVSGRGIGLDVVKTQVEQCRGTVGVASEPGRGTRFTLTLPLTLSTIRALLIENGGQPFAIPSASIERLVRVDASAIRTIEGREVVLLGQSPIPIGSLTTLFAMAPRPQTGIGKRLSAAVLSAEGRLAVVLVDELVGEQEVVLKPLGARLKRMKYVSAATILPSGRVAPVLAPSEIVRDIVTRPAVTSFVPATSEVAPIAAKRLILADDSVTTRTLEKSILEAAGYEVLTAVDGSDAWHLLQDKGADLVVSDVEMPKMDGFSLTETIRGSKRFRSLPVVLVTALETDRDRARGLEAGADAYLPKSTFDQKALLETIRQLL
jgi:two-component system, chemotaxis family, sensor kinase CheA